VRKALLIIDVQNDYFVGGKSELVDPGVALANIEKLLQHFRAKGMAVIHVQHINNRDGAVFFLPNTDGARIHKKLTPQEGEYLVVKHVPNSFYETNLRALLKENAIGELVVCGMMTHMCVDTTVRACKDFGVKATLIDDACATKNLADEGEMIPAKTVHEVFMASLNGMFADVTKTDRFIEVAV
jgi:nicotinamidase-related amidase